VERHSRFLAAAQQIALPMTGDGAVLDFSGPFPNGDGIDDLTTAVSTGTRMPRAGYPPLGPKVLNQLWHIHLIVWSGLSHSSSTFL
jgi:hypothetical protein